MKNLHVMVRSAAQTKGGIHSSDFLLAISDIQNMIGVSCNDFAISHFAEFKDDWENFSSVKKMIELSNYVAAEIRWLNMGM